jgi:hypothetical protein
MPHGARGGAAYVLRNDRAMLFIREARDPAKRRHRPYNVTVKHLSVGLWQWGLNDSRNAVAASLCECGAIQSNDPKDPAGAEPTISRADYAFDFHAPAFTRDAVPGLVGKFLGPAHTKWAVYGHGEGAQTFTVGNLPRLQVTVYDKSREIREASGKDWMRALWGWPEGEPCADVWRIECRMGEEYLRDRNIRHGYALHEAAPRLLGGALVDRRLTDGPRERLRECFIHPLWFRAWEAAYCASETHTIGRLPTLRREEYRAMILRQMAGMVRNAAVAMAGDTNPAIVDDLLQDTMRTMRADQHHDNKVARAKERHRFIADPQ